MIRIFLTAILGLALTAPMVQAQEVTEQCGHTKSTGEYLQCLKPYYETQQEELNEAFTTALSALNVEQGQIMKTAQNAWVVYRDLECSYEAVSIENASLERVKTLECLSQLTNERISTIARSGESEALSQYGSLPRWMNVLGAKHLGTTWDYAGRIEGDLDCDSENEYAMSGIETNKDGLKNIIIAIAESATTGKPKTQSFTLSVDPEICNPNMSLSFETLDTAEQDTCPTSLKISDGKCYTAYITTEANEYALGKNLLAPAPTPEEKPAAQGDKE